MFIQAAHNLDLTLIYNVCRAGLTDKRGAAQNINQLKHQLIKFKTLFSV